MARQIPEVSSLVRCVITNFFRRGAKSSARSRRTPLTVPARFVRLTELSGLDRRLRERTWAGPDGGPGLTSLAEPRKEWRRRKAKMIQPISNWHRRAGRDSR